MSVENQISSSTVPPIADYLVHSRFLHSSASFLLLVAIFVLAFTAKKNVPYYFGATTKTNKEWNNSEDFWTKSSSPNHSLAIMTTLRHDFNRSHSQTTPNVTNASIDSTATETIPLGLQNLTRDTSTSDTHSSMKTTTFIAFEKKDKNKDKVDTTYNSTNSSISCHWSPKSHANCLTLLRTRLPPVSNRKHWFLFGDSTMRMLWLFGKLNQRIISKPLSTCRECRVSTAKRCHNNAVLGLSIPKNWTWHLPDPLEGPTDYGLKHSHCMDCNSCLSNFVSCNQPCPIPFGGYIAMEYARDVELQSADYNTTQENIALFIQQWMTAANNTDMDSSPICIINVGIHDITIPLLTDESFFINLKWMFHLLNPLCGHFVWIHLTAPFNETYNQKTPRLKRWNEGVLQMLNRSPDLKHKASVLDVFAASQHWKHKDNVHMDRSWYVSLGEMLLKLL